MALVSEESGSLDGERPVGHLVGGGVLGERVVPREPRRDPPKELAPHP
jgi:hypothetical protein